MTTAEAKEYGKRAYKNKVAAPVLDKDFMANISGPIGSNARFFKAWNKGWTEENLKELVF